MLQKYHLRFAAAFEISDLQQLTIIDQGACEIILLERSGDDWGIMIRADLMGTMDECWTFFSIREDDIYREQVILLREIHSNKLRQKTIATALYCLGAYRDQIAKYGSFTAHELIEMPHQFEDRLKLLESQHEQIIRETAIARRQRKLKKVETK